MDITRQFQETAFKTIYKGLVDSEGSLMAFTTAIVLTSDDNISAVFNDARRKQAFIKYMEMMKGNMIVILRYNKKPVGRRTKTEARLNIKQIDNLLRKIA